VPVKWGFFCNSGVTLFRWSSQCHQWHISQLSTFVKFRLPSSYPSVLSSSLHYSLTAKIIGSKITSEQRLVIIILLISETRITVSTQPSILRGMVKWVSAFRLSNNNKWRWMVGVVSTRLQADSQPGSFGLVWGSAAAWRRSVFITWTGWTLAVALLQWQHHKHSYAYYYYYYYYYYYFKSGVEEVKKWKKSWCSSSQMWIMNAQPLRTWSQHNTTTNIMSYDGYFS